MTSLRINDAEQALLRASELSPAAKLLYLLAIRPHMDYATGIAGKTRRLSYQQMHEILEYRPPKGSTREAQDYSPRALRCLLDELERAGLIRRLPNRENLLFLQCLAADRRGASKNMNVAGTSHNSVAVDGCMNVAPAAAMIVAESDAAEPMNHAAFGDSDGGMNVALPAAMSVAASGAMNVASDEGMNVGTSGIRVNHLSVAAACASTRPVENSLLLRAEEIVGWLCAAERARGKVVRIVASEPLVTGWASLPAPLLRAAYAAAVADREARDNPYPINAGFLDVFVRRLAAAQLPGRRHAEASAGIEQRARKLGVTARPGESWAQFAERVQAAHDDGARRG